MGTFVPYSLDPKGPMSPDSFPRSLESEFRRTWGAFNEDPNQAKSLVSSRDQASRVSSQIPSERSLFCSHHDGKSNGSGGGSQPQKITHPAARGLVGRTWII